MSARRLRPIRFAGPGSGQGPLTWAQADHWSGIVAAGAAATFGGAFLMPDRFGLESAVRMIGHMLSRHQALRTRLGFGPDGWPFQRLSAAGELALEIVEPEPGESAAGLAEDLAAEFGRRPFDYECDWPVRAGVVLDGDRLWLVIIYLHLALDGAGAAALQAEFDVGRPDPVRDLGPVTAVEPLAQARDQATPAAQRQSRGALQHFDRVLTATPAQLFPPTGDATGDYQALRYHSPLLAPAVAAIAQQHLATPAAVHLAVFGAALARLRRLPVVWAMVLVSNRFRPRVAGSVSLQVQSSPFLLDVGGADHAQLLARAGLGLLATYKNAYYDYRARDEVLARAAARHGQPVQLACFYNDRGGAAGAPSPTGDADWSRLQHQSRWWPEPARAVPRYPLSFNVDSAEGTTQLLISWDAGYFAHTEVLQLAGNVEAAALALCQRPHEPVLTTVAPATALSGGRGKLS